MNYRETECVGLRDTAKGNLEIEPAAQPMAKDLQVPIFWSEWVAEFHKYPCCCVISHRKEKL